MPNQGKLLFDSDQDKEGSPAASNAPAHGLLATNHLNLMFALSAGMVMPPAGFGEKHYRDTLSRYPGWIPLFVKKPFKSAIEEAVSEADHLIPCVARISLDSLTGPVAVVRDSSVTQVDFQSQADQATDSVILVPAPLPTSWIQQVYFRSKQDNKAVQDRAKDYGNVSFEGINRLTKPHFFTGSEQVFPEDSKLGDLETSLGHAAATGGILGMLVPMGNLGDVGLRACRLAFGCDEGQADQYLDPILLGLGPWLKTGRADERPARLMDAGAAQLLKWLFWGSVDRAAQPSAAEHEAYAARLLGRRVGGPARTPAREDAPAAGRLGGVDRPERLFSRRAVGPASQAVLEGARLVLPHQRLRRAPRLPARRLASS